MWRHTFCWIAAHTSCVNRVSSVTVPPVSSHEAFKFSCWSRHKQQNHYEKCRRPYHPTWAPSRRRKKPTQTRTEQQTHKSSQIHESQFSSQRNTNNVSRTSTKKTATSSPIRHCKDKTRTNAQEETAINSCAAQRLSQKHVSRLLIARQEVPPYCHKSVSVEKSAPQTPVRSPKGTTSLSRPPHQSGDRG